MKPLFDDNKSNAVSDRPSMPSLSPVAVPAAVANVVVPAAQPTEHARLITVDEIDQLGATQGTRIAAFSQQILASVRASDWSCPCNSGHADTVRLMTPHYA
ncbi:hypothetical protein [Burkholderia cenocepacia]|uniref:hypothetical protein n=1 Tax=Burkholderia cenocepacia TaxID=95486 RepID=UPI0021595C00|nr:hypothetical protein [Burkholderia cenocepacia]